MRGIACSSGCFIKASNLQFLLVESFFRSQIIFILSFSSILACSSTSDCAKNAQCNATTGTCECNSGYKGDPNEYCYVPTCKYTCRVYFFHYFTCSFTCIL